MNKHRIHYQLAACAMCLLLSISGAARSAFIPDLNMRVILNDAIPGIVDADGNMDTAHAGIPGHTDLQLYVDRAPADLTGLQYLTGFAGSGIVNTSGDRTIPAFPEGLQGLEMEGCEGVVLNSFPSTVQELRLAYTIRFQNTGKYLAQRFIRVDTLSASLDGDPFRTISSSHENTWTLRDGVPQVVYDSMDLPDSTSDEPNSHGFLKFSILPQSGSLLGGTVESIAYVHLDFNEPIVTAPTVFSVEDPAGLEESSASALQVYPNLVSDRLMIISGGEGQKQFWVLDAMGRQVVTQSTAATGMWSLSVDRSAAGLYTLRMRSASGDQIVRFAKRWIHSHPAASPSWSVLLNEFGSAHPPSGAGLI